MKTNNHKPTTALSVALNAMVIPICEHRKLWKTETSKGIELCGKIAKFIIHYDNGDKFACGIHARGYNKRAIKMGLPLAELIKNV